MLVSLESKRSPSGDEMDVYDRSLHEDNNPPPFDSLGLESSEDVERDVGVLTRAFLMSDHGEPQVHSSTSLPQPFCLPQISSTFDSPFARGYSPALGALGISQQEFLDFIDGLNVAMISSPPLEVLGLVGVAIGFVPHWDFVLAGIMVQVGAKVGSRIASKKLTDRYLQIANSTLFGPAGLHAYLCKTPAVRVLLGMQVASAPKPPKLVQVGRSVGNAVLQAQISVPFMRRGVRSMMDKVPPVDPEATDPLERRMSLLDGYALQVNFADVPPPMSVAASGMMDKMSTFAVRYRQRLIDRRSDRAMARRQILAGMPVAPPAPSLASTMAGMSEKEERKRAKRIAKNERKVSEGDIENLKRKVEIDDLQEYHQNESLIWLVIVNKAEDEVVPSMSVETH